MQVEIIIYLALLQDMARAGTESTRVDARREVTKATTRKFEVDEQDAAASTRQHVGLSQVEVQGAALVDFVDHPQQTLHVLSCPLNSAEKRLAQTADSPFRAEGGAALEPYRIGSRRLVYLAAFDAFGGFQQLDDAYLAFQRRISRFKAFVKLQHVAWLVGRGLSFTWPEQAPTKNSGREKSKGLEKQGPIPVHQGSNTASICISRKSMHIRGLNAEVCEMIKIEWRTYDDGANLGMHVSVPQTSECDAQAERLL
mmetsp:Transcript_41621/g.111597  ORF Transcript_41621/g.111597 Transcript_41621/m.111597 type:complete len:255 (-) Transcript_41621:539-1303(-)